MAFYAFTYWPKPIESPIEPWLERQNTAESLVNHLQKYEINAIQSGDSIGLIINNKREYFGTNIILNWTTFSEKYNFPPVPGLTSGLYE